MTMKKIESNDLLMEILVKLPPKSVFRFRCVSKRWNNIVADSFFIQSYEDRQREARLTSKGLMEFIGTKTYLIVRRNSSSDNREAGRRCSRTKTQIFPLTMVNDCKIMEIPEKFGHFIHSSNGLILCRDYRDTYYVLNPRAKTFVCLLPRPGFFDDPFHSIGLVCEENTRDLIPSYKVIMAEQFMDKINTLSILTYSSKTCEWTNSTLVATDDFLVNKCKRPLVFNGVFHLFLWDEMLAVFDTNQCDNHLLLINLPYKDDIDHIYSSTLTRSSSNDVLWFGYNKLNDCLEFWMLPKDQDGGYKRSTTIPKTEWILMHTITHDWLRKEIRTRRNNCVQGTVDDDYFESSFVGLEGMIPGNPLVAVLRLHKIICLYNLETRLVEPVLYLDSHIGIDDICNSWNPYMEPLSLSLYALSTDAY